MIFILETGSLGNQLFQYNSIKHLFPGRKYIFCGFDKVHSVCDSNQFVLSRKTFRSKLLFQVFYKLLVLSKLLRLFNVYQEFSSEANYTYKIQKGLFGFALIIHNAFFQHKQIFPFLAPSPIVNRSLLLEADEILSALNITPTRQNLFFIHIRRGDYLTWPSAEMPAAVTENWLLMAVEYVQSRYSNSLFIVLGNDSVYNQYLSSMVENSISLHYSESIDFALMSLCVGGILSPSTYSWWASFYARQQINSTNLFVAPRFWAGHRKGSWYPQHFYSDWLTYI